jgi:hypothetical protein
MPTERLSMRRIRQVLQLHFGARASARVIAGTVGVDRSTVQDYLAPAAGVDGRGAGATPVPGSAQQAWCAPLYRARLVGAGARDETPRGQSVGIV